GLPRRRPRRCRAPAHRAQPADTRAAPVGGENLVEALPVGMGDAEKRAERRPQQRNATGGRRSENCQRVAALGETDRKAVVAERAAKAGGASADRGTDRSRAWINVSVSFEARPSPSHLRMRAGVGLPKSPRLGYRSWQAPTSSS